VDAAPNNADILDTLGWVLLKQDGASEEAVTVLRRSVQLNPGNPSIQYHLGIALRDTGDVAGAREALGKALESETFPEASDARAALAAL
jgi:Flp pilus assembly protein TadD